MAHYLGIDLGTSAIKAVVVDDAQVVRAQAAQPIATMRLSEGRVEQDPDSWWTAMCRIGDRLKHEYAAAMEDVRAVGLSGQMHGAVLIASSGAPLRPAIIWSDARSHRQCLELVRNYPELVGITGVLPMPGFTAPKLMWIAENEPETYARIATVLLPKDYLRFKMTGECVSDMSDAAGSWWLDEVKRNWSPLAIAATRARLEWMPKLVEGNAPAGILHPNLARRWGLRENVPVAGGAGDAAAAAIGLGAIADGAALISLGTAAQLFVTTQAYRPAAAEMLIHAFCHALPKRWFQMAAMLNGASCLAWAADLLGRDISGLLEETEAGYRRPQELLFLPYLSGERTPHNNPRARGVIFGASADTNAAALTQAVLEGVAYSIADAQESLGKAGTPIDTAGVVGGGAKSKLWTRILANVLNMPLTRYVGADIGPAFGAARLARMAATGEGAESVAVAPEVHDVTYPEPALAAAYRPSLERFRHLYLAVRDQFEAATHDTHRARAALERH
jgi:xylulokinase